MSHPNQSQVYLKTKIQTASKEELILMLFDGVLRFCEQGKQALGRNDIAAAHESLLRAQQIVMELLYCLDRKAGEAIAENLARLYGYSLQCLIDANIQHEPSKIEEVQKIFRGIREGWLVAMEKIASERPPEVTEKVTVSSEKPSSAAQNPPPPLEEKPRSPQASSPSWSRSNSPSSRTTLAAPMAVRPSLSLQG